MKVRNRMGFFPMFPWAGFWMTLLLPLLFSLFLPNPVSASNVASGLTISTATSSTHQRKSFYANGRYWVFYSDATNMVFKTSVDGISWSSATTVRAADSGSKSSVFFDGTYVHYAYSAETANTPIYYRRGTPNSNGTITWSADEQTALAAVSTDTYNGPNITVATDGRAWIGYEKYTTTGPARSPYITRNLNTDGTWSTDTGNSFPYMLRSQMGSIGNVHCVQPVPLTSGYVFCVYGATGFTLRGKRWDGSWGTEKATTNAVLGSNGYSAVNEGNDVHLCFVTGSNPDTVIYAKYTYASDSFGGETTIQSSPNGGLPALSLDTTTNTLYCFWRCYNNNTHIYYKRKNSAGTWDSSYTDWIDESTDGLTAADRLTAFYRDYGGKIGLVYMARTSTPWKVNFAQLSLTGPAAVLGKPMVAYSEDGQTAVKYSTYSSGAWAAGATATDGVGNVKYWKVAKTHPAGRKRATVFLQENTTPRLYATLYDDSQWDDGTASPFNGYGDAKDLGAISAYYRCFDAAYEQVSGKLMVVAATGDNTISYWTWDAGTWSSATTYSFANYMGTIYWIKIAAKPASNEITLIASGSSLTANALVWSGSAWGNESNLTSSLTTNAQEAIGVEYTRAWGDIGKATVFWATANTLNAKMWNGSTWGSTVSKGSLSASIRWLRVKADPNSNKIVVAYEDSSDDIYALIWNAGSWFTNTNSIDTAGYGSYANHRPFDVIYETGSYGGNDTWKMGHVLVVYADTTELRYRHCYLNGSSSLWCDSESNVRNGATTYQAYWVQLERAPDNTIHLAIHDTNEDLVTWTWNNTSWTYENTISSDLERDANHNDEVFALFPIPEARAVIVSSTDGEYTIDYSWYHDGAAPAALGAVSTGYANYWKVARSSADGSKQIAVSVDFEGTWQPHLWGTIYNGSSWSTIKDFGQIWSYQDYNSDYVSRHRSFDAAFETSDGHIVVVATKTSPTYECWYWTYNGTTWSSANSLTFTNIFSGQIKWVKLAPNPNTSSNEIALIVATSDYKAVGKIWNGSSWGNEQSLTSLLSVSDQEAIAVEYMQTGSNGGKALFAWAQSYTIYGRVWNGSSWDSAQSKSVSPQVPQWLRLAADPASDDLMLGFEDAASYLYALKWTGAAWETSSATTISSNVLYADDEYCRPFDVIWESGYGHTGHAIIVYTLSGGGGYTYYKHYDGSSWGSTETQISIGAAYFIELARTTDNTIHVAGHETSANHLITATWNNSSWSHKSVSTGIYIEQRSNYGLERGTIRLDEFTEYLYPYHQVFSIAAVATTAPQIHAVDYNFGVVGATITLYGVGFGNAQGSSTVKFYNNQTATVTTWSDVKLVVTVPSSTASGYITVTRGSNSDTISFIAITGAPTITAILPDRGSNFSDIDIAYITGTNFSPGATVKFTRSGQSDITATNVTISNSTRIETATLNTTSAATGYWNVVVTNPDTQSVTSANAFAVNSANQVTTGTQANYADLAYPNERHLVRDSDGNWYAVFYSNDNTRIYITKSTNGTSWDSPTTLVGSGGIIDTNSPFRFVSVDVYRTGNVTNDRIHIVWRRGADGDSSKYLWYSRCINLASYTLNTSWKRADEVTTGFEQLDSTSIASEKLTSPDVAVDSGGYPHVAWNFNYAVGSSEAIRYRTTRPSGSWATTVTVAVKNETGCGDIPLGYPSIDTDSSNSVHISYSQYYNTAAKYVIRYAKSTNYTSFSKSNLVEDTGRNFYQSSLIVDSADKIYVAALDDTNRDLFWAHYNGSTWSTTNNLTNGSFDIESAVVGAKMGGGIYDHVLLSKVYDASANKKVIYWRWNSTNSNWSKYSEELDTGNESRSYVTIERHAPASSAFMGYLFYDTSGDRIYFDKFTNLGFDPGTAGFPYRRPITIPDSMTPASCSSSLTSFPVLVKFTDATLKSAPYGGHVQNANGWDIIFRGDNVRLDHEIEKYDPTTGELVAWVRIPTLVHNAATTIYMYYGNSTISSSTANPTEVWSNGYTGVWHLKEDPSGTAPQMKDSTANAYHGTSTNDLSKVTGQIGDATSFPGNTANRIDVGGTGASSITPSGAYMKEAWVKFDSLSTGNNILSASNDYAMWTGGTNNFRGGNSGDWWDGYYPNYFTTGTWYHLVLTFDPSGSGTTTYYVNGTSDYSKSPMATQSNTGQNQIGNYASGAPMTGVIDELRLSTTARNACWIGTTYNSVNSPASVGNEETNNPTVVKLKSFTAAGNGKHVKVDWETASEIDNLGFNLYRSTKKEGSYTKLNTSLIPGLLSSPTGRKYSYADKKVIKGKLYYYKLEDIDLYGTRTMHGPVCVDWNGDGIPDDEQSRKARGLSAGGSSRRSVLWSAIANSPYAEGSRLITPETRSFTARQRENRVLLEWRTAYEVNILGYHVYREENGEFIRVTPELVAGSALFAGNALPAGNAYAYWDDLDLRPQTLDFRPHTSGLRGETEALASSDLPAEALAQAGANVEPQVTPEAERSSNRAVTYWLEEISLNGDRSWCGPVTPIPDETLKIPEYLTSPLLSGLGTNQSGQPHVASRTKEPSVQRLSTPGPIDLQWDLASAPAIKLSVNERGWYRVTRPQLVAAGLDRRVDPRLLQLFVDGTEQPIYVKGEKDGRFGRSNFIEFYGEGLDTLSTDTRTYWLVVGQSPGKRISTLSTQLGQASSESSFPFTLELKERTVYFSALRNGEQNNFFGPVIGTTPVERSLTVPYPDPAYSGNATITVSIQGVTVKPHQVQVLVNEEPVGEVVFDGQAYRQVALEFPQSTLLEGENTITLAALGQDLDVTLLDTVQLTYWRTFTSDGNDLEFTLSSSGQVSIDGFRRRSIRVADVTDPEEVRLVSGTRVSRGSHGYAVRFNPNPGSENRTWLAFSKADIKTPVEIKANQVSTWHQENQGADLVIISHADFKESLQPLKTHRESQGYSVALIDIEDIFDEFSYGTKTPQAIKDFLTRANTSWQTSPRFVLLAGDASFDPRNYLNLGNQDFLPTKLLDTAYMETASDDWFVDFDNDGLPDMAIGRLPVQTAEEAETVVSKIIAYDQAPSGDWAIEALMVADQNDSFDFEGGSQEVDALLPESMTVWSIYRGQAGDDAARAAILGSINEGKLIVNYMGHGAVDLWRSSVLTATDADSLTNGSALPLVVGMTCLNGFFQTPYVESLAEALLKADNGGAVAVWTSSGLTDPAGQLQMNKGLVQLLFNGQGLTLGEAVAQAKAVTNDQDVRKSWILFGDPTTRLKP